MRKFLIIGIWIFVSSFLCAQTKPHPLIENLNISIGGGINFYDNDAYSMFNNVGFGGEVSVSKWVSSTIGIRAMANVMQNHNAIMLPTIENKVIYNSEQVLEKYQLSLITVDASILLDLFQSTKYSYNSLAAHGHFLCGFGGIISISSLEGKDVDFFSYAGYHYNFPSFKLSYTLSGSIYIEPRFVLLQPNFDNNKKISTIIATTIGFNLGHIVQSMNNRFVDMKYQSQFWKEDWFMGLGGAVNSFHYNGKRNNTRLALLKPTFQLTIGKYNSSCVSSRLHFDIGALGYEDANTIEGVSSFSYGYTHVDIAFNISKWLRYKFNGGNNFSFNGMHKDIHNMNFWERFHVEPFVGAGVLYRTSAYSYVAEVGIRVRYKIGNQIDLYLEPRYTQLMSGIVKNIEALKGQSSWHLNTTSLMLGVNYNIGRHNFNY